jgi:hypothetical protein
MTETARLGKRERNGDLVEDDRETPDEKPTTPAKTQITM